MNNIRFFCCSMVILLVLLLFSSTAFAEAEKEVKFGINTTVYVVNGTAATMDCAPYAKGGRTYLPLRFVADALGISNDKLVWNGSDQTITLTNGERIVKLQVGSTRMSINHNSYNMDASPEIVQGRTMLPIRPLAEAFGMNVTWDEVTQTFTLKGIPATSAESDVSSDMPSILEMVWVYQGEGTPTKLRLQPKGKIEVLEGKITGLTWTMEDYVLVFLQNGKPLCRFTSALNENGKVMFMGASLKDKTITHILKET